MTGLGRDLLPGETEYERGTSDTQSSLEVEMELRSAAGSEALLRREQSSRFHSLHAPILRLTVFDAECRCS
jgi:hypothetical protein